MKHTLRSFAVWLLLAALMIGCIPAAAAAKFEGSGYKTPEKCLEAALNYLKKSDLEGIISTCAIESAVENSSLTGWVTYQGYYDIGMPMVFESEDALSREINAYTVAGYLGKQFSYVLRGLSGNPVERSNEAFKKGEENQIPGYVDSLYDSRLPDRFATIRIGEFLTVEEFFDRCQIPDNIREQYYERGESQTIRGQVYSFRELAGAEELSAVIASFTMDGEICYAFGNCVKYHGKWYLSPWMGPGRFLALRLGKNANECILPILTETELAAYLAD